MKLRLGGRRTPVSVSGPLVSLSAALMRRFIPIMKRATDIVHPVIILFSMACHSVVSLLTADRC